MNQVEHVIKHLNDDVNLVWINTGRVSDNWKAKIFGHKITKRQIGIYKRDTIVVRLEIYDTNIAGVIKRDEIPTSHALDIASISKFKDGKGVCVKVDTLESFKNLLNWYFPNA
jgi:hypothetical protein